MFSYNAIVHIEDKARLFREIFGVLRPGGRLVVSDWMRGANPDDSMSLRLWDLQGLTVNPDTVPEREAALIGAGFVDVSIRDRSERVAGILKHDHDRLLGPLSAEITERVGEHRYRAGLEIREVMYAAMAERALCAAHMWARKPK